MAFNPNIPLSTDVPAASQQQLLDNFGALNTIFGTNHVTFDAASNNGYHTQVNINAVLAADPNLAAPISSVYTRTVSGAPELFFQNGALASDVVALTGLTISQNTTITLQTGAETTSTATNYGITTPWGLILNWGNITMVAGQDSTVRVTLGVPFALAMHSIMFGVQTATGLVSPNVYFDSTNNTVLNLRCPVRNAGATVTSYYFAIGV